jgi:tripartite-type tricarboxylate transporter receptor subunit TctC
MIRQLRGLIALACIACGSGAWAQAWPAKPIRMILAFPPGGPTDIVARVLGAKLADQLGQQVLVDNKPGAGGNIGAELAAKAPNDGYTIFYNTSAIVINPALYGRSSYDTLKDFLPVTLTAAIPMVLVVHPAIPVKTMKEFVDYVKSRPGQINYSSSGTGTITHLASAMLASQMGFSAQHIAYKGSAPGLVDLAAGQTQFMTDTINTALPYVKDGRLRAIAVTSAKRSSVLPDMPTFAESGMPGFDAAAWQGVVVPAGTPAEIVARLGTELNRALSDAGVRQRLAAQGADALGGTPAEYAAYIRAEMPRWAKAIKDSGAKAE